MPGGITRPNHIDVDGYDAVIDLAITDSPHLFTTMDTEYKDVLHSDHYPVTLTAVLSAQTTAPPTPTHTRQAYSVEHPPPARSVESSSARRHGSCSRRLGGTASGASRPSLRRRLVPHSRFAQSPSRGSTEAYCRRWRPSSFGHVNRPSVHKSSSNDNQALVQLSGHQVSLSTA